MRVLFKVLSVLFVIVFVFSLATSIIFAVASPVLSNSEEAKRQLYYSAAYKLHGVENITITSSKPSVSAISGRTEEDKISCSLNEASSTYSCSMISKLYDSDSKLIKTSYFPGDGFKYTEEGENKPKTPYSNTSLVSVCNSLMGGANTWTSFLAKDNKSLEDNAVVFGEDISFSFSEFSLTKKIAITYEDKVSNSNPNILLEFDKNNYLKKITYKTDVKAEDVSTLEFVYEKTTFSFPSFAAYASN